MTREYIAGSGNANDAGGQSGVVSHVLIAKCEGRIGREGNSRKRDRELGGEGHQGSCDIRETLGHPREPLLGGFFPSGGSKIDHHWLNAN